MGNVGPAIGADLKSTNRRRVDNWFKTQGAIKTLKNLYPEKTEVGTVFSIQDELKHLFNKIVDNMRSN